MPSTNGHGLKRAILYARVSTDEQARSGYSLAQQLEAMRDYAAREGYEVLEEVSDPGQSGASLERPGMDKVRDLVAVGGVSVVLAQDRDRFAREPAYHYLLKREFEEHGTLLRALNDRGDESPEGQLTDGILDQLAKYERAKTVERTRRGKLRKAREGKVIATRKPPYGFRYNEARDGLVVYEPEMAVVEQIFRLAAGGRGTSSIQTYLYHHNIPTPTGARTWERSIIKKMVMSDIYLPHTYEETAALLSPEAAAALEPGAEYGIRWGNRFSRKGRQVSEPDGDGGRRYRRSVTTVKRSPEEWIAVPVPAWLPRDLVEQARQMMASHRAPQRTHLAREWELRGLVRCTCGVLMGTRTTNSHGKIYYYYECRRRDCKRGTCKEKAIRAERVEAALWQIVSSLLTDPERTRIGFERLIEQERSSARRGDPEREAKAATETIAECARLRGAYQDQQAAGLMTLDELGSKLSQLEEMRLHAERAIAAVRDSQKRIEALQRDRDALLEAYSETVPEDLESLTGEERNTLYRKLQIEVTPAPDGLYDVVGALCTPESLSVWASRPRRRRRRPWPR
jgi:site-specific DNA recombinase